MHKKQANKIANWQEKFMEYHNKYSKCNWNKKEQKYQTFFKTVYKSK